MAKGYLHGKRMLPAGTLMALLPADGSWMSLPRLCEALRAVVSDAQASQNCVRRSSRHGGRAVKSVDAQAESGRRIYALDGAYNCCRRGLAVREDRDGTVGWRLTETGKASVAVTRQAVALRDAIMAVPEGNRKSARADAGRVLKEAWGRLREFKS